MNILIPIKKMDIDLTQGTQKRLDAQISIRIFFGTVIIGSCDNKKCRYCLLELPPVLSHLVLRKGARHLIVCFVEGETEGNIEQLACVISHIKASSLGREF